MALADSGLVVDASNRYDVGALIAALKLAGVPIEIATPAVLLYRTLTFWLPVLPGWACFSHLQRKGVL